jgi:hypothetical protein
MRQASIVGVVLSLLTALAAAAVGLLPARAEDKADTQITVLAGEWKITYTNDAVRVYTIDTSGKVSFAEEKLQGQIKRKDGALLLTFEGDNKVERLTLGTDGRLFVEHYDPKDDFPDKKAAHIGIGTRQK